MNFPEIEFTKENALELEQFREMDYYAVENYQLPIELMMENAGLHLARLVSTVALPGSTVNIGVGNGNNGGGGLVAARRLAAWGYNVFLDFFTEISKPLPKLQVERALQFGVKMEPSQTPDVWVDAWLGFSQKLPLPDELTQKIVTANNSKAIKISLDIPTGFLGEMNPSTFNASKILTLAAPKKILLKLPEATEIFVADLGIPVEVYHEFGVDLPPFHLNDIIQLKIMDMEKVELFSTLTCPNCGHQKTEEMPTDGCQFFYECENCKTILRPKPGDCCVYCSYGSVKCPSKQGKD